MPRAVHRDEDDYQEQTPYSPADLPFLHNVGIYSCVDLYLLNESDHSNLPGQEDKHTTVQAVGIKHHLQVVCVPVDTASSPWKDNNHKHFEVCR